MKLWDITQPAREQSKRFAPNGDFAPCGFPCGIGECIRPADFDTIDFAFHYNVLPGDRGVQLAAGCCPEPNAEDGRRDLSALMHFSRVECNLSDEGSEAAAAITAHCGCACASPQRLDTIAAVLNFPAKRTVG